MEFIQTDHYEIRCGEELILFWFVRKSKANPIEYDTPFVLSTPLSIDGRDKLHQVFPPFAALEEQREVPEDSCLRILVFKNPS